MVILLDADKEGFLRNVRSITQIAGRAARHTNGRVLLYGDNLNNSLRQAIAESNRRREKQVAYNIEHGVLPKMAMKSGSGQNSLLGEKRTESIDLTARPIYEEHYATPALAAEPVSQYSTRATLQDKIAEARKEMEAAAKSLDFIAAARHRDRMRELQKALDESKM